MQIQEEYFVPSSVGLMAGAAGGRQGGEGGCRTALNWRDLEPEPGVSLVRFLAPS